jgi:hypothetical protein
VRVCVWGGGGRTRSSNLKRGGLGQSLTVALQKKNYAKFTLVIGSERICWQKFIHRTRIEVTLGESGVNQAEGQ